MTFETEIQESIYNTLIGDSTLTGYLGGDRVYLEWNEDDLPVCTSSDPGWIGIESLTESAPMTEKQEVSQRVVLFIHTRPEDQTLRQNIRTQLVALFHAAGGGSGIWKNQTATTTYAVRTKGGGIGNPYEYRGLLVLPFYIDVVYKPKSL